MKDFDDLGRADRLRALNAPRPIRVKLDKRGRPTSISRALATQRTAIAVANILDRWRIDDEWWRNAVSRMYFQVELEGGQVLILFHDLITGRWYQQNAATPVADAPD